MDRISLRPLLPDSSGSAPERSELSSVEYVRRVKNCNQRAIGIVGQGGFEARDREELSQFMPRGHTENGVTGPARGS